MPDSDEQRDREVRAGDLVKPLIESLLKNEAIKGTLGRRTRDWILVTLIIAIAELTVGLPVITLASSPIVGGIIVFILAQVEDWIRSRKPATIFYLCPKEEKFIRIKWSSLPRYKKLKGCADCGAPLIKRCQQGKHYIISPDLDNPEGAPPKIDGFCPLCDLSLPEKLRMYLPKSNQEA